MEITQLEIDKSKLVACVDADSTGLVCALKTSIRACMTSEKAKWQPKRSGRAEYIHDVCFWNPTNDERIN